MKTDEMRQAALEYHEGEMFSLKEGVETRKDACWLEDESGDCVAAVANGAGIKCSKAALKHAAMATQALPDLVEALRLVSLLPLSHGTSIPAEIQGVIAAALAQVDEQESVIQ